MSGDNIGIESEENQDSLVIKTFTVGRPTSCTLYMAETFYNTRFFIQLRQKYMLFNRSFIQSKTIISSKGAKIFN